MDRTGDDDRDPIVARHLALALAADHQLEYATVYASGRDGWATLSDSADDSEKKADK